MPQMSIQISHALGREEATRRIQAQLLKVRENVTVLQEQWQDHTLTFKFRAMGFDVGGTVVVEETTVQVNVNLPLAALMVKNLIEGRVRQELGTVLA
jgi:hypothetical protein